MKKRKATKTTRHGIKSDPETSEPFLADGSQPLLEAIQYWSMNEVEDFKQYIAFEDEPDDDGFLFTWYGKMTIHRCSPQEEERIRQKLARDLATLERNNAKVKDRLKHRAR